MTSNAMSSGSRKKIRKLWPRTRGAWTFAILALVTFFVLDVLALMGSDLAVKLLSTLAGMLLGMAVAYAVAYPFRKLFETLGVWRILGVFLGLALVFGIIVGGSVLAGIPLFPTAEGGDVGALIYGLAFGFGLSVARALAPSRGPAAPAERGGLSRSELKFVCVIVGGVVSLFAAFFALFLLIEYVVTPLIRYLVG